MAKALGTTDSVTTCDCCGKSNLKLTVCMELDCGDIAHYGTTCASRNTGKTSKQINSEIKAEELRIKNLAAKEFNNSPQELAYRAKLAEANRNKIPCGKSFMEYVSVESEASDIARKTIATKYKLPNYSF